MMLRGREIYRLAWVRVSVTLFILGWGELRRQRGASPLARPAMAGARGAVSPAEPCRVRLREPGFRPPSATWATSRRRGARAEGSPRRVRRGALSGPLAGEQPRLAAGRAPG